MGASVRVSFAFHGAYYRLHDTTYRKISTSSRLLLKGLVETKKGNGYVRYLTKTKNPPLAKEISAAEFLAEKMGVRIFLRGKNVEGADALMNGIQYDIKTLAGSGKRGVSTGIKNGMRVRKNGKIQANRFIIDGRNVGLEKSHFLNEIQSAIRDGYRPVEVIGILKNGEIYIWP